MPMMDGLRLSELLSARHREIAKPPSYNTLAGVPGAPAGGDGPYDPSHPLAITPPPSSLPLADPVTLNDLAPAIWGLEHHFRQVAERVTRWPACDWHAIDRVVLSSNPQVDGYQFKGNPVLVHGRAPTRRLTVYNPTQAPILLGQGGGSALAGPAALVPAESVMTLPWNADDVEIACDPIFLPATSGLELATIMLVRSDRETDEIVVDRLGQVAAPGQLAVQSGSTQPLGAAGVWIGPALPGAPGNTLIRGQVFADVGGTFSMDTWIAGAWRQFFTAAVVAATVLQVVQVPTGPWIRGHYVNGAGAQATFEVVLQPMQ